MFFIVVLAVVLFGFLVLEVLILVVLVLQAMLCHIRRPELLANSAQRTLLILVPTRPANTGGRVYVGAG